MNNISKAETATINVVGGALLGQLATFAPFFCLYVQDLVCYVVVVR